MRMFHILVDYSPDFPRRPWFDHGTWVRVWSGHLSRLGGNSGFTLSILTSAFSPLSPPTQTQISTWFSWVEHFAYFCDFRSELKILYFYQ